MKAGREMTIDGSMELRIQVTTFALFCFQMGTGFCSVVGVLMAFIVVAIVVVVGVADLDFAFGATTGPSR